jgi:hypothetical protein
MRNTLRNPIFKALAAMALLGAAAWAQKEQLATVQPYEAESGRAFRVTILGKTELCDPQFSHQAAKTGKGTLDLSAMAVNNPVAKCTAGPHDYKVDFDVPALQAGKYEVTIALGPACLYANPMCEIAIMPQYAGALTVRDSADLTFAIRPKRVAPDKAFDLFLTGKNITCGDEFSNLHAAADGNILRVSFTDKPNPAALCPAILTEYGPTFKVPALAEGTYQVFATRMPFCNTAGPCPLALVAPQLAGALVVAEGSVGILEDGTSGSAAPRQASQGRSLRVDLTRGTVAGAWKDATRDLSGRNLPPSR